MESALLPTPLLLPIPVFLSEPCIPAYIDRDSMPPSPVEMESEEKLEKSEEKWSRRSLPPPILDAPLRFLPPVLGREDGWILD
jgi:hypothetical protein